jgi:aspartate aminotransferase
MISETKGISCVKPDGAFYVFCDVSKLRLDSLTLARRLLDEAKVAVVPGAPFGSETSVRLSFATSEQNIKKGLGRIKEWVDTFDNLSVHPEQSRGVEKNG